MIEKRFRLAVLWLMVVLFLGSAQFGPKQTQQQIVPTLRTLAPWMATSGVDAIHALLRRLSHLTEYVILALVWLRAFRAQRFTLKTASWAALAVCLACAIVDEAHQASVPAGTAACDTASPCRRMGYSLPVVGNGCFRSCRKSNS